MTKLRSACVLIALSAGLAVAPAAHAVESTDPAHPSLSFLRFIVTDLPKMEAFYAKAFGMAVQKRLDNGNNLEVIMTTPGGMDLALEYWKDNRKLTLGDANGAIGFYLKDVDGAYKRAMDAGAKSRTAPTGGPGGIRVAVVTDPEGHDVELLHLP
jgi:predicted enzyme related to lactoylglutathione lyase